MSSVSINAIGVAMFFTIAAGIGNASTLQVPDTPAIWVPHAIILDLDSLPKRYSCDDLWYRFRALLLSIGAQPTSVMPYHCDSRSPSVELQFSIPRAVQAAEVRYSDLQAVNDTVLLEPARPAPFDAADCELMRQIKDQFFPTLPVHLLDFRLNCLTPQTSRHYHVSLQILLPRSQQRQIHGPLGTEFAGSMTGVGSPEMSQTKRP